LPCLSSGRVCETLKFAEKKRRFANLIFGVNNYFIRRYTAGNAKFAGIVDRRALFVPVIDAALRIAIVAVSLPEAVPPLKRRPARKSFGSAAARPAEFAKHSSLQKKSGVLQT